MKTFIISWIAVFAFIGLFVFSRNYYLAWYIKAGGVLSLMAVLYALSSWVEIIKSNNFLIGFKGTWIEKVISNRKPNKTSTKNDSTYSYSLQRNRNPFKRLIDKLNFPILLIAGVSAVLLLTFFINKSLVDDNETYQTDAVEIPEQNNNESTPIEESISQLPESDEEEIDIEKADDAVVLIKRYDAFGGSAGHGSGFIIDVFGTVVTNYHVVKGVYRLEIVIEKNGSRETYDVDKIISGSESKDIAKIAIKRKETEYFTSYLKLAESYPKKGEDCWAIGTPWDPKFMNTVSKGLVSNLFLNESRKGIQTNAEFSRGSSGGPLLNSNGEVIGITTGIWEDDDGNAARANLNYACSVKELNDLPSINRKNLVDPNSIPCKIAFYTDDKTTGNLYFYVDGIFLGSFDTYFTNKPSCGEYGTITKVLYSGNHNYQIYNKKTGKSTYDNIFIEPGNCEIIRVWMQ